MRQEQKEMEKIGQKGMGEVRVMVIGGEEAFQRGQEVELL